MPLAETQSFPSDRIELLNGFEDLEPKIERAWSRRFEKLFPYRLVVAINQHYPEIASGFYRNRRLVAIVQHCLRDLGVFVVIEDNLGSEGAVPVELPGSLELSDDYLLVDIGLAVRGRLNVWESCGGRSPFYHDKLIMEMVTDMSIGQQFGTLLTAKCNECSISNGIIES